MPHYRNISITLKPILPFSELYSVTCCIIHACIYSKIHIILLSVEGINDDPLFTLSLCFVHMEHVRV